jgi:hypothetical protein
MRRARTWFIAIFAAALASPLVVAAIDKFVLNPTMMQFDEQWTSCNALGSNIIELTDYGAGGSLASSNGKPQKLYSQIDNELEERRGDTSGCVGRAVQAILTFKNDHANNVYSNFDPQVNKDSRKLARRLKRACAIEHSPVTAFIADLAVKCGIEEACGKSG